MDISFYYYYGWRKIYKLKYVEGMCMQRNYTTSVYVIIFNVVIINMLG